MNTKFVFKDGTEEYYNTDGREQYEVYKQINQYPCCIFDLEKTPDPHEQTVMRHTFRKYIFTDGTYRYEEV